MDGWEANGPQEEEAMKETIHMVKDVVCGMEINPAETAATKKYGWKTYYFCSQSCFTKFNTDPEKYAGKRPDADGHGGHSSEGASCCSVPREGEKSGGCSG